MLRAFLAVVFLAIWLPSIMFAVTNVSTAPPLEKTQSWKGPYKWKFQKRDIFMHGVKPELLLYGNISTTSGPRSVVLRADLIEWLYASGRHRVKLGKVYATGLEDYPFVSDWDLEHDAGLQYAIGGLRFNGAFIFAFFFCLVLPVLFVFWMLADDVTIDSPQERKRKQKAFEALVQAVEQQAKGNARWLRKKTITLALLGYVVVLGSILLMIPVGLGLGAAVVVLTGGNAAAAKLAFVLAIVPIGFAWHMGKSLLSGPFEYSGLEVTAQDCPALFALMEKICTKAQGPMFKRVFIDNQLNASVTRSGGLLGFFGMGPVVLTLGLPLMQSQTQQQLAGVIGHEYGHVAAKDNAWGQWVYRIRNSWLTLDDRLRFEHLWYVLKLNRFYEWFMATFSAHSFALSRQCEYEADAFSARVAGKEPLAEALSSLVVYGERYEDVFWRDIWAQSDKGAAIDQVRPYAQTPQFFNVVVDVQGNIKQALARKTGFTSTHPAISDRLAALGQPFTIPQPPGENSAAVLLGPSLQKLTDHFDREWQEAAQEHWQQRQEENKHWQERYAVLKEKPLAEATDDELSELISAASRFENDLLFFEASQEIYKRHPESAGAALNCIWYRLMVEKDEGQLQEMELFLQKHPDYEAPVCRYAIEFLTKAGRQDAAEVYVQRLEDYAYLSHAAEEERQIVLSSDNYKPHALPDDTVERLKAYFAQHPIIKQVYVAQKQVKYMTESPCYILAYTLKPKIFATQKKTDEQAAAFIYESGLPEDFVFIQADSVQGLEAKIKKVDGAKVYKRA